MKIWRQLNSEATGYAGENLKGSTGTARACLMGANLIDAGGLLIEINQRPPAEVGCAPSRGHPHTPQLVVAD